MELYGDGGVASDSESHTGTRPAHRMLFSETVYPATQLCGSSSTRDEKWIVAFSLEKHWQARGWSTGMRCVLENCDTISWFTWE